jgi:hypothetical protein
MMMPCYTLLHHDTQRETVAKGLTSQFRLYALVLCLQVSNNEATSFLPCVSARLAFGTSFFLSLLYVGLDFPKKRRYTLCKIYPTDQGVEQEK